MQAVIIIPCSNEPGKLPETCGPLPGRDTQRWGALLVVIVLLIAVSPGSPGYRTAVLCRWGQPRGSERATIAAAQALQQMLPGRSGRASHLSHAVAVLLPYNYRLPILRPPPALVLSRFYIADQCSPNPRPDCNTSADSNLKSEVAREADAAYSCILAVQCGNTISRTIMTAVIHQNEFPAFACPIHHLSITA